MYEQDQWSTLYIVLVFVAFISVLALRAARSRYRRNNVYEPWHAELAATEGKPRHDGKDISKTSSGWVSGVLLSVVALAATAVLAIFFWLGWPDNIVSATLRDIRAAQQQTTSGKKAVNDSHTAEDRFIALAARLSALENAMARILGDYAELQRLKVTQAQMAQDNASVAEQLKALTHRDNASAAEKLQGSRENMAGALAQDSGEILRPQLPHPNPTPAIPKRRQDVMRNWF
jgi:hypothetical protein